MKSISDAAMRVTTKTCSRKFVALGRVLRHWSDIMGADFAQIAQPVKINYRRSKKKDTKAAPNATLVISTTPSHATALHYQSELILERINQVFGQRWITGVQFVSVARNDKAQAKEPLPDLSDAQEKQLEKTLNFACDDDIKNALARLGRAVMKEDRL